MKTIRVVCEGQTEANFVKKVLFPYFDNKEYVFIPEVVVTSVNKKFGIVHKGGISDFGKVKNDLSRVLSQARNKGCYVTTMFDYYALPENTPGKREVVKYNDVYGKVNWIEGRMGEDLDKALYIYKCILGGGKKIPRAPTVRRSARLAHRYDLYPCMTLTTDLTE